jgi:hypothetical protein
MQRNLLEIIINIPNNTHKVGLRFGCCLLNLHPNTFHTILHAL